MTSTNLTETLARLIGDRALAADMERCARAFDQYRHGLPFVPSAYTRTKLVRTDGYELVAMQWAPGSVTPIHDHGLARCWVLMLEGTLDVQNYLREDEAGSEGVALRETEFLQLAAGSIDHRLTPRELHRVSNTAAHPAFSIQLYAAPIGEYNVLEEPSRTFRSVTAIYDHELPV